MMLYDDNFDSKKIRNIIKEARLESNPLDAVLIANAREISKKMMVSMERDKYGKLKNAPISSVEEDDNVMQ